MTVETNGGPGSIWHLASQFELLWNQRPMRDVAKRKSRLSRQRRLLSSLDPVQLTYDRHTVDVPMAPVVAARLKQLTPR